MGDDDYGLAELVPEAEEKFVELGLGDAVEIAGRLVREEDCRVVDEGSCYGDPLLFSAGKFRRLVPGALFQSEGVEEFQGFCRSFFLASAGNQGRNHYVFEGSEFRKKVVELEDEADSPVAEMAYFLAVEVQDIGSVNGQGAEVRCGQGAENLEQCGLAGS